MNLKYSLREAIQNKICVLYDPVHIQPLKCKLIHGDRKWISGCQCQGDGGGERRRKFGLEYKHRFLLMDTLDFFPLPPPPLMAKEHKLVRMAPSFGFRDTAETHYSMAFYFDCRTGDHHSV